MQGVRKPRWQQATALVSLSTCGAMTGFALAHGAVADLVSPTSLPVHVMPLAKPAGPELASDSALRSAIVKAASAYLRMAKDNSPAAIQALIWQQDSIGGADHGESCAAFASLVLEMGAQATGQQSWVTGGGTYPWPLHAWADVRVEPNPDSPGIVSILQDAQAHGRWHLLGDGYTPQPGDWVLFDGHVEVVIKYIGGVLYTIGGDSMPNLSVNAHHYSGPLAARGVIGFVNNGDLVTTASRSVPAVDDAQAGLGGTAIPGLLAEVLGPAGSRQGTAPEAEGPPASPAARSSALGAAEIPGLETQTGAVATGPKAQPSPRYGRSQPPAVPVPETAAQQAFISEVAPGAVAAQRAYGVPAAVTIAQAIDESGWGQSSLATQDHNLFGIKGTGPAGSVVLPTEEYDDGTWVATSASFRVYYSVAESIADHTRLLATGESYQQAMADRHSPDAFADDLSGVYATDPNYGTNLISIMRLYNLYRYDPTSSATPSASATAPTVSAFPRVTTPVAAADYGADVPGLEPTGLALGGPDHPGTAARRPAHDVPRPQLTSTKSKAAGSADRRGTPRPRGARTDAGAAGSGAAVSGYRLGALRSRVAATESAARGGADRRGTPRPHAAAAGSATTGGADRRGVPTARVGAAGSGATRGGDGRSEARRGPTTLGGARIPGLAGEYPARAGLATAGASAVAMGRLKVRRRAKRYAAQLPSVVTTDFVTMAKQPLGRSEPMYQDVARGSNIPWQVLAACDWMQCKAQPRYSPVRGERLGARNPDGTRYRTKSGALEQCAADLIALSDAVYGIDLTAPAFLSVLELAQVFAAFRWGRLLREHRVSAMEFPYSVEGLTVQHLDLRWPDISAPNAPDKPGTRFRMPFGAVPVVLSLNYPAVA